jgi:hypothetical protein
MNRYLELNDPKNIKKKNNGGEMSENLSNDLMQTSIITCNSYLCAKP